jgi:transposase
VELHEHLGVGELECALNLRDKARHDEGRALFGRRELILDFDAVLPHGLRKALLPDREPATAQAWFTGHPTIEIIARDRGGGYGEAAAKALPDAVQLADRWHLMENASRAFLDAVRKSMRQIRSVIGATTINPELLTAAERIQYEGYLRREQTNATILALVKDGVPLKQIARQTGHSSGLVQRGRREDRGGRLDRAGEREC